MLYIVHGIQPTIDLNHPKI